MHYTWLGNGYAWDFFLVPACVSLGCMLLCIAIFGFCEHVNVGNGALKDVANMPVPGLESVANHPQLYADGHAKRFGGKAADDVLKIAESGSGNDSGEGSGSLEGKISMDAL